MDKKMSMELQALLQEAARLATAEPEASMVLLAKTETNEVRYCILSNLDPSAQQNAWVNELKARGETRIRLLLCLWTDGLCLDVPSRALYTELMKLDPGNGEALVLLMGEHEGQPCYMTKALSCLAQNGSR